MQIRWRPVICSHLLQSVTRRPVDRAGEDVLLFLGLWLNPYALTERDALERVREFRPGFRHSDARRDDRPISLKLCSEGQRVAERETSCDNARECKTPDGESLRASGVNRWVGWGSSREPKGPPEDSKPRQTG